MRHSFQRDAILDFLRESTAHPTADTVFENVREELPSISLGTVYRNLRLLSDEGMVDTVETLEKSVHYDGNTKPHSHFVCTSCGSIIDLFFGRKLPPELAEMGLIVESEKTVFYGKCLDCQHKTIKNLF